MMPRPHDLIWLSAADALQGDLPDWVGSQWRTALPLVVRRDSHPRGLIPVGVRGMRRDQRAAGWVNGAAVCRRVSPESLADTSLLLRSPFISQQPVQAATVIARQQWPWTWGITGSCGYALATEVPVLHSGSDLDLLIRAPQPLERAALLRWQACLAALPCRADTQAETPYGAFALNEWLRDGKALLKTQHGPRLVSDPWLAP